MGRSIWPTSDATREASRARLLVSAQATTSLVRAHPQRGAACGSPWLSAECATGRRALKDRCCRCGGGRASRFASRRKHPFPSLALRLEIVLWSGTSLSRFRSVSSERRQPAVCLDARPNTTPKVTVVSMAWFEYWRCRPGVLRVGLGEFQLASLPSVSPSQTVRLPRARRPVSYSPAKPSGHGRPSGRTSAGCA